MKDLMYFNGGLNYTFEILIHSLDFKIVFTVYSAMKKNNLQMRNFLLVKVTLHSDKNLPLLHARMFYQGINENGDIQ